MPGKNRYLSAFTEQENLTGLAVSVGLSAALLNPLPLLAALVAETAYLLTVPDSKWYAKRLSRRHDEEIQKKREELKAKTLPLLEEPTQARFAQMERIREQLDAKSADDGGWLRDVLRKLDYLLEKFLVFAAKDMEFRRYLAGVWQQECGGPYPAPREMSRPNSRKTAYRTAEEVVPPLAGKPTAQMVEQVQAAYAGEVTELQKSWQEETDSSSRDILGKRIEVLKQRSEGIGKIGRILANLQHQMGLLEDTFGLINDQIHARSPEQVLSDIEAVVYQTDSMTKLLEEMAPFQWGDRE